MIFKIFEYVSKHFAQHCCPEYRKWEICFICYITFICTQWLNVLIRCDKRRKCGKKSYYINSPVLSCGSKKDYNGISLK